MKYVIFPVLLFFIATHTLAQNSRKHYLFYLHGKIIEDMGKAATNPQFGHYELDSIINGFKKDGFEVICDLRPRNTAVKEYAQNLCTQVNKLIKQGTPPGNITIVGASKGAVIAMLTCACLQNKQVNFVFMAACNESLQHEYPEIKFYGNILSIYEQSDDIGRTCAQFKNLSPGVAHYKEIMLQTGRKHRFLYKPLAAWMAPAEEWALGDYR